MKCHYEVLNVSRSADDNEIKSSYRKLALKWHPDKNLDNPEIAKEQFQIVQQAYEILSDRQERAWYDNHRDQILRGPSSEFEDKSLNVFQYFTTTCFKGYGDDEKGFYTVYRKVFHEVAKEDMEFMEDKDDFCNIPDFGNSLTDYEKVSEFYTYWLNYLTKKSYVWLDAYDVRLIQDRRYTKLAEKENKKVRQAAKKDRNEEVRNLVAFVKKRDKRVQAQRVLQEQKLVEDKKKREMLRQQKKLERQEELKGSENQPEWAKFDNVKSELKEIEKNLAEQFGEEISNSECEEEEEYLDDLYCVACNKLFKTPKAFENHESSKKHKENVEILKATMLEEEEEMNPSEHSDEQVEENHKELDEVLEEEIQNDAFSNSDSVGAVVKTKKKKKKTRAVIVSSDEEIPDISIVETNDNSDDDFSTNKRSKKKKKNSNKAKVGTVECNEISTETKDDAHLETEGSASKISKKEKRKEKKNKKEAPVESNSTEVDIDHVCVTCKGNFPSKNKLFDHLKKTRHGVYIPELIKSKNKKKSLQEE